MLLFLALAVSVLIETEDVSRFYRLYDATHGRPTGTQVEQHYLRPGSDGLHRLLVERPSVTARTIAANILKHPEQYKHARGCTAVLPGVKRRLSVAMDRFKRLYPEARFPPITIVVSRGKPAAIAGSAGVIASIETLCAVQWMDPNIEDRLVHVLAHEYTHVQQAIAQPALYDDSRPTLLQAALIEGAAEFTAQLISGAPGEVWSSQMLSHTTGREHAIESSFVLRAQATDLSQWIDDSTMRIQGDQGYWVGYRIVRSYYDRAPDKRKALRDIIQMNDPRAFLKKSGWYPGKPIAIPHRQRGSIGHVAGDIP
jgi:Predicted Zn-dependent protease (DUF2268)